MLLAEKKMEEIEGKMKGWEHFQERAKLNAILWDFPKGEIILGVVEVPGTLKKKKQNMTKHVTTKRFLRTWTKYGEKWQVGNNFRREPGTMPFWGISPRKISKVA